MLAVTRQVGVERLYRVAAARGPAGHKTSHGHHSSATTCKMFFI